MSLVRVGATRVGGAVLGKRQRRISTSDPRRRDTEVWRTVDRLEKPEQMAMALQIRHMWPI
jgi:hypothetical protein